LALCGALALVGCGDGGRLDASSADALRSELTRIERAVASGRCGDATRTIELGRNRIEQLPASVDGGVVDSLEQGFALLESRVKVACEEEPSTDTTTTETVPPETTTATTPTVPTTTTETTPTTPTYTAPEDLPPDDPDDEGDDEDDGSGGFEPDPGTSGDALRGDGTASGLRSRPRPDDAQPKRSREGQGPRDRRAAPPRGPGLDRGDR